VGTVPFQTRHRRAMKLACTRWLCGEYTIGRLNSMKLISRARMSSPRHVTIVSVLEEKKRLSAQSVQSARSHASSTLVDRRTSGQSYLSSNTFGKPMPIARDTIEIVADLPRGLPSPRTVMFERPLPAPPVQRVPLAASPSAFRKAAPAPAAVQLPTPIAESRLNKVKTRSRVWGFLGKKKDSGTSSHRSVRLHR
jgi:hypothetical protein